MSPVVSSVEGYFISYFFIISIQLYLDALWTLSILVVCIFPLLYYLYTGFFRLIAIFDIEAINSRGVTSYCLFFNRILYYFSFLIFWKVGKDVFPFFVYASLYCRRFKLNSVLKQVDCDFLRTLFILIITIIPGLLALDLCLFRFSCICYLKSVFCRTCGNAGVTIFNLNFLYRVLYLLVTFIFVKGFLSRSTNTTRNASSLSILSGSRYET